MAKATLQAKKKADVGDNIRRPGNSENGENKTKVMVGEQNQKAAETTTTDERLEYKLR